jgi:signal transduction histidine kinase
MQHEWCAPGISPLIDEFQDVPADRFPWAMAQLARFQPIDIRQTSDLPLVASAEKDLMESLSARSVVIAPMTADGMLAGFLGFSSMRHEKQWSNDGATLLAIVGEIVVNALQRKHAQEELDQSQQQLRALSARLLSIQEQERTRIAREAHDELGQSLTALRLDLASLRQKLSLRQTALRRKTKAMIDLVDTTISSVRRIAMELRPGMLDDLGLLATVEWQLQDLRTRTGIATELSVYPEQFILDPDRSTTVFRIVQEALTNVTRHAQATSVRVSLRQDTHGVSLEVSDNGRGIRKEKISDRGSLGLIGIRERVLPWGGRVEFVGREGTGTCIAVYLPIADPAERAVE